MKDEVVRQVVRELRRLGCPPEPVNHIPLDIAVASMATGMSARTLAQVYTLLAKCDGIDERREPARKHGLP